MDGAGMAPNRDEYFSFLAKAIERYTVSVLVQPEPEPEPEPDYRKPHVKIHFVQFKTLYWHLKLAI
jgi:hypothetical protein